MPHRNALLTALALPVLIASTGMATAAPEVTDATVCNLITGQQIAAVTKGGVQSATAITFITAQARDVTCTYKSAKSTLDDVQLVISIPKSASIRAEDIFASQKERAVTQGNIYKRPPHELAGIGDTAFWDQSFHNFVVLLRDRNLVIRLNARDQAGAQTLAEAVSSRLNAP